MQLSQKLARRAVRLGLALSDETIGVLGEYFELLRRWNRRVSLTALPVEDYGDEAIDRLLIEPVIATRYVRAQRTSFIDIGSGGGSPAIPLRLAVPGSSLVMVESKTRKAAFLREVVRHLNLDRAHVEAVRMEELLARPDFHDIADVATVRAVRLDPRLLSGVQSFVKPLGRILLFGSAGAPKVTTPQVAHIQSDVLIAQWGSRVEVLEKRST